MKEPFSWILQDECRREIGTSWKNCPTPKGENLPDHVWNKNAARYGFSSLSKVRKWFGKNEKVYACMQEYGFVLRRYSVDSGDVFQSPTQCIVMVQDLVEFEELEFSVIYEKSLASSTI
jgi:hypothetical protein